MYTAAENGHSAIVKNLIDYGANSEDIMSSAVSSGSLCMVRMLLDRGIDVHNAFLNPLYHAVKLEHEAMFRLLIERGADLRRPLRRDGGGYREQTTSDACMEKAQGSESMMALLNEHGVDVESWPWDLMDEDEHNHYLSAVLAEGVEQHDGWSWEAQEENNARVGEVLAAYGEDVW